MFEKGLFKVLIATKSLLGEGWDSPCINTLIMASFVGSYVLSNQMRGRAIRFYNQNVNKKANDWHLALRQMNLIRKQCLKQKIENKCLIFGINVFKTLKMFQY